jgi:hypothetical protein
MERLWSLAGTTSGNRWQMGGGKSRETTRNQSPPVPLVAAPPSWYERVDGSSPSGGLKKSLEMSGFLA